ncbi:MAG: YceI family protein [Acidobacteriota bacterium]
MRRILSLAGVLALAAPLAVAQTSTWTPDPAHSDVLFTVRHLSLTNVHGRFGKVTGTIHFDSKNISQSSVQVSIDVTAVDTGVPARDNDLRSANFFDVAAYPTASFQSTKVAEGPGGLTITGNLTLRGVTKPVTLHVVGPMGPVNGMDHKPHMGYSATTLINRLDFGIGPKYPDAVIGDQITLTIDLDVAKQQ